jgi:hypothetical protein
MYERVAESNSTLLAYARSTTHAFAQATTGWFVESMLLLSPAAGTMKPSLFAAFNAFPQAIYERVAESIALLSRVTGTMKPSLFAALNAFPQAIYDRVAESISGAALLDATASRIENATTITTAMMVKKVKKRLVDISTSLVEFWLQFHHQYRKVRW